MNRYVISWISFFDNSLRMSEVRADSEYDALKQAYLDLTSVEYEEDQFDKDSIHSKEEQLKQAAFDCDGMIGAYEVI